VPEQLLTVEDVAKILKVNARTVMRYANSGELVSIEVGSLVRFRPSDLDDYLKKHHRKPKEKERHAVRPPLYKAPS